MDNSQLRRGFNALPKNIKNNILQSALANISTPNTTTNIKAPLPPPPPLPRPKLPPRTNFPYSTNAITRPLPQRAISAMKDVRSMSNEDRAALAGGPTVTVLLGSDRYPVFSNMPARAIAAISPVAATQINTPSSTPSSIWITKCSRKALLCLCYYIRNLVTSPIPPTEPPGIGTSLQGAIEVYHAGRALGMELYLFPVRKFLLTSIPKSASAEAGIQNPWFLATLSKLSDTDPVYKCAVAVAARIRRERGFRDKKLVGRFRRYFPGIVDAMDECDKKVGRKEKEKVDEGVNVVDYGAGNMADWLSGL